MLRFCAAVLITTALIALPPAATAGTACEDSPQKTREMISLLSTKLTCLESADTSECTDALSVGLTSASLGMGVAANLAATTQLRSMQIKDLDESLKLRLRGWVTDKKLIEDGAAANRIWTWDKERIGLGMSRGLERKLDREGHARKIEKESRDLKKLEGRLLKLSTRVDDNERLLREMGAAGKTPEEVLKSRIQMLKELSKDLGDEITKVTNLVVARDHNGHRMATIEQLVKCKLAAELVLQTAKKEFSQTKTLIRSLGIARAAGSAAKSAALSVARRVGTRAALRATAVALTGGAAGVLMMGAEAANATATKICETKFKSTAAAAAFIDRDANECPTKSLGEKLSAYLRKPASEQEALWSDPVFCSHLTNVFNNEQTPPWRVSCTVDGGFEARGKVFSTTIVRGSGGIEKAILVPGRSATSMTANEIRFSPTDEAGVNTPSFVCTQSPGDVASDTAKLSDATAQACSGSKAMQIINRSESDGLFEFQNFKLKTAPEVEAANGLLAQYQSQLFFIEEASACCQGLEIVSGERCKQDYGISHSQQKPRHDQTEN